MYCTDQTTKRYRYYYQVIKLSHYRNHRMLLRALESTIDRSDIVMRVSDYLQNVLGPTISILL